jgi:dTMP kinase
MKKGKLIVFEGIHGSGKSTQINLLSKRLKSANFNVTVTKEVSGTPLADDIGILLKTHAPFIGVTPLILLLAASRLDRIQQIILPALQKGAIVIADRYSSSMVIEQGYGQKGDLKLIASLNKLSTKNITPDLVLLLDLSAQEAYLRRKTREVQSYWDKKPLAYHERSRKEYLKIAQNHEYWHVVDASKKSSIIESEIYEIVTNFLESGAHE